ncbi:2-acylglycerophosphoethanolamine acyltransferase [Acuticoccus sediminis]|uniref:2-acylglycerophosphoethanolamine acyltransferase n=1 Tax=Acuticoccus sediminis TaxID=2184697 RepID=A0A8B2NY47_9HYPH|nr:AMP-binding protein [Acuticoccus sediminis]RAI00708.1 2-acylglycerophosphoethanolamine acyltransferase [Acuticoccus sediminis]
MSLPPGGHVLADGTIHVPAQGTAKDFAAIEEIGSRSVLCALRDTLSKAGPRAVALEDADRRPMTYRDLVRAAAAFSRVLKRSLPPDADTVAIMLPSSVAAAIAYYAALAAGLRPAMLNFTAGEAVLRHAVGSSGAAAVITADRFLAVADLEALAEGLATVVPVLKLEEMRKSVGWRDKAFAAVAHPLGLLPRPSPDDTAAIIFTSGSEGQPKGVVLSHRNLLSNCGQVHQHLPLDRVRVFFNPMPVFHSLGLGPGMILPLSFGMKLVLHPSPLRIKEVTQRIAETQANVLLTTDTFLRQYARVGADGSLSTLQFAVCGAERVRVETRTLVRSRFGFEVVEGYGVTETSPVIAVNHPDEIRDGTVGRMVPALEARLEPVPGLDDGWRLHVRGPNVMKGYIGQGGAIVPPPDGWHDTGDVVAFESGFLAVRGRLKRFAKLGGEMTSLVTVENLAGAVWPEFQHAATAVAGGKKGEIIVLLTESPDVQREGLQAELQRVALPERYLPARIFHVEKIPLLGTGKLDTVAATRLAEALVAAEQQGGPPAQATG